MQLVSVSMKLRQMFYTQIERQTFHTAWVRLGSRATQSRLPLFPQQQTLLSLAVTSEKCHTRTHAPQQRRSLFDHIIGERQQVRWGPLRPLLLG